MKDYISSKERLKNLNIKKMNRKYNIGIAATWVLLTALIAVNFYIIGGIS